MAGKQQEPAGYLRQLRFALRIAEPGDAAFWPGPSHWQAMAGKQQEPAGRLWQLRLALRAAEPGNAAI
jgi:hypothetical protein